MSLFSPFLESSTRSVQSLYDMYEARKEGGVSFLKQEEIENQRTLIWAFVKQAGMHLLSGNSLTDMALPVGLSEPRSLLQRIASEFSFAPVFLHRAAEAKGMERMKLVIAFVIAGLHRLVINQKKPFDPTLGETYQASFFDGTKVFLEQISHHPSVSCWEVDAPKWKLVGSGEATACVAGGNSISCGRRGSNKIFFHDGSVITYTQPTLIVGGLMFGTRTMEFIGNIQVQCEVENLASEIMFDAAPKTGFIFSTGVTDLFKGSIICVNDPKNSLCDISGSWIRNLSFDGNIFWDIKSDVGYELILDPNPLLSDSSFREDIIELHKDNVIKAQIANDKLEHAQRADAKLRKKHTKIPK